MPIYFKELEYILNHWKMHSSMSKNSLTEQLVFKKRMINDVNRLFKSLNHNNIHISEEANLDRTYGAIKYKNIVRVSPQSKL